MTEEETKVFYEVMYVYAQKILKQLIIKYCKKHDFNYFISLDKSLTKEKD